MVLAQGLGPNGVRDATAAGITPAATMTPAAGIIPDPGEPTLARARALTDQRDFSGALALYRRLLEQRPRDDDLAIEIARVLGFADRNAESAALYRQLLDFAPQRRGDVLLALAWQTLWSGEAESALALFAEALAPAPDGRTGIRAEARADAWRGLAEAHQMLGRLEDALVAYGRALEFKPADLAIERRRAQLLLWLDRHDESIAAFEALLARHPADRASALGLAQARNFAGRHRSALATWRGIGAPTDDAERFEVARALRWAGFDDLAHQQLEGVAIPDAQWLRVWRTAREVRPAVWATLERSTDRDRLETRSSQLGATLRVAPARHLDIAWRRVDLSEPGTAARGDRLAATYGWRVGDPYASGGTFWPSLSLAANRYPDWSPMTGAARLRWQPRDGLRLDADWSREPIETPLALLNRVTVATASLGVEWRPTPRWSASGNLAALRFDDGNRRLRFSGRADYALRFRPKVTLGLEGQVFSASDPTGPEQPARGYWNPRRYQEARVYLGVLHDARPWEFQARLGFGLSRETDGFGNRSSGSPDVWELAAVRDLSTAWRARLFAGGSGSALSGGLASASGGTGYWRRYLGATLTGWW